MLKVFLSYYYYAQKNPSLLTFREYFDQYILFHSPLPFLSFLNTNELVSKTEIACHLFLTLFGFMTLGAFMAVVIATLVFMLSSMLALNMLLGVILPIVVIAISLLTLASMLCGFIAAEASVYMKIKPQEASIREFFFTNNTEKEEVITDIIELHPSDFD